MLGVAAVALFLSTVTDSSLGAALGALAVLVDEPGARHARRGRRRCSAYLPTRYWLAWVDLFRDPILWRDIERGVAVQASTSSCCSAWPGPTSPPRTSRADPAPPRRSRRSCRIKEVWGSQVGPAGRRDAASRIPQGPRAWPRARRRRRGRPCPRPAGRRAARSVATWSSGQTPCSRTSTAPSSRRSSAGVTTSSWSSRGSPSVGPGTAPRGSARSRSLSGASCWQASRAAIRRQLRRRAPRPRCRGAASRG